jgi:hypothetical protein
MYDNIPTIRPINVEKHGYHTCGENWGFCGEHAHFIGIYRCCYCNAPITTDQCAAWPITEQDCPRCYRTVKCELTTELTGCTLR